MTAIVITISGEVVDLALEWAKEHCSSYITSTGRIEHWDPENPGRYYPAAIKYDFLFSDEKDATMFALRWL